MKGCSYCEKNNEIIYLSSSIYIQQEVENLIEIGINR